MTENIIKFAVFKESKKSFLAMLDENDIDYIERPGPVDTAIKAAGEEFAVILNALGNTLGATSPYAALAYIIVSWQKARASRKIMIQTKDQTVIHLEGYSVEEAEKLLERAQHLMVVDTKPTETEQ